MADHSATTLPAPKAPQLVARIGSPFSPGIPLEAHQPIFGREDAFRFIAGELARFKSVNLIGERRMGKTSMLKHLLGNRKTHLANAPDLVLVHVDLQDNINKAEQFYGKALRGLLEQRPASDPLSLRARLQANPEATAIEFETTLKSLKEAGVRPVFLIDEFERVFEPHLKAGFPFPDFFDGLRAQITANRAAIVLFTREKLLGYFTQQSLTSTFPSYFQPFTLRELSKDAADDLLLRQPSDHPLITEQARQARLWAGLHPCHLQCAGAAWYQAQSEGKPAQWAKARYVEIVEQNGFVNPAHLPVMSATRLSRLVKEPRVWFCLAVLAVLGWLAWRREFTHASAAIKDNYPLLIVLAVVGLFLFGKVTPQQLLKPLLDKFLGEKKEKE